MTTNDVTAANPIAPFQHPRLTMPPPLMMSEPGSFANITLTQRWPAIAQRVMTENQFPSEINAALEALSQELLEGNVRHLQDDQSSDLAAWTSYLEPFADKPWLEMPWFFAEVYFYRRLLEATQYFQPGAWQGVDPFLSQKQAGLATAMMDIQALYEQTNSVSQTLSKDAIADQTSLISLLYSGLWGNRADLSLKPTATATLVQGDIDHAQQTHILVDDTPALVEWLTTRSHRVDFIADNAGFELVCDLFLIDFLLTSQTTSTIYLHLKAHPTFVSDATIQDVHQTLEVLAGDRTLQPWAKHLKQHIIAGRLRLCDDAFWTAPLVFWEMPRSLHQELAQANLVLIKGDANYRRLLGDCHWSFTTPFSDIACYFPAPLMVLRTLKSEVIAGLHSSQIETLNSEDPQWLTNGKWGVIQFVDLIQPSS